MNEYNVLVNGKTYRVTAIFSVADETNTDPDTQLVWLRKFAPRDHLLVRLKDEGITHVMGGDEEDMIAIPIKQASDEYLQNAELLRPLSKGESFVRDECPTGGAA